MLFLYLCFFFLVYRLCAFVFSFFDLEQGIFGCYIDAQFVCCCRHLIGFFLFLSLTIYTAMKIPKVVDLHSLQHFPDVLKHADLHKLQSELLSCMPSLANMSTMDLLPSPSTWHITELLTNCLPERLFHANHTDVCVLVQFFFLSALWLIISMN